MEQVKTKNKTGKEKAIQKCVSSLEYYPRDSPRAKKIDMALAEIIALDVQPMLVVEDIGSIQLLHSLDLRYQLPNTKTISCSILPQKYDDIKSQIKEAA